MQQFTEPREILSISLNYLQMHRLVKSFVPLFTEFRLGAMHYQITKNIYHINNLV